jgi:hypothetical protein
MFFYLSEVMPLPVPLKDALATRQKKMNRDAGILDDEVPSAASSARAHSGPISAPRPHNPSLNDLMNPAPSTNGSSSQMPESTQAAETQEVDTQMS